MPTYQYACRSCGHRFDAVQGFDDASLTTCPACHQQALRKLFGNVGVVFKGSGFYRTDSRNSKTNTVGAGSGGGSGSAAPSESGGSSSTSSPAESAKSAGAGSSAAGTAKPQAPASTS